MKKMIKLVAGAVTFGVLSGSVFTGTEYALNRVTGSGITQTQSSKTAATTTKQSDDRLCSSFHRGDRCESGFTDTGFLWKNISE